jgi:hypothetical protein
MVPAIILNMPFRLNHNWSRWKEGEIITGGDIADFMGSERGRTAVTTETDQAIQRKIAAGELKDQRGVPEERIAELIRRGILTGIGDDARIITPPQEVLLITERIEASKAFDLAAAHDADGVRNRVIRDHMERARQAMGTETKQL